MFIYIVGNILSFELAGLTHAPSPQLFDELSNLAFTFVSCGQTKRSRSTGLIASGDWRKSAKWLTSGGNFLN
jgi:hypothetical protein